MPVCVGGHVRSRETLQTLAGILDECNPWMTGVAIPSAGLILGCWEQQRRLRKSTERQRKGCGFHAALADPRAQRPGAWGCLGAARVLAVCGL